MTALNTPRISILTAVYNPEKYLAECIESILSQTYHALQIICVNDGSSDGSLDVLEQYAAADSRITIESQSNQGVSAARNRGLEIATGEYIGFVDSGDWLEHCKRTNTLIHSLKKGEVQLTQELKIYLVQHSTIFTALPSLVQYFKHNNLLFTRKALDLLAMADHNWFWLPSQIRSLRLSVILHLLRGKYYQTLFALWSLKTVA